MSIPANGIRAIRIDPLESKGQFELLGLSLNYLVWHRQWHGQSELKSLVPNHEIEVNFINKSAELSAKSTDKDPSFVITDVAYINSWQLVAEILGAMFGGMLGVLFFIVYKIDYQSRDWFIYPSSLCFAIAVCFFYSFIMYSMFIGDFINSYPYLSPDGFDYIYEGLALKQLFYGLNNAPWPILRNPGYVIVTFVDSLLNANGKVIIGVQGLAIFTMLVSVAWIAKRYGYSSIVILSCLFGLSFMPLGYIYFWVLSDTLCTALMMASLALLIYFNDSQKTIFLILAFVFSLVAGLTQTYGMIPFVILTILLFLDYMVFNNVLRWKLLAAGIINIIIWFILQKIWEALIPHISRPQNFDLLHIGTGMASFYFNVWGFALLPLLPVILITIVKSIWFGIDLQAMWLKLCMVVLFFTSITFCYQWQESRFTFIYIPLVFILIFSILPKKSLFRNYSWRGWAIVISSTIYGLLGLMVSPANYWKPELSTLRVAPFETWISKAWLALPNDRFQLEKNCNNLNAFCEQAQITTTEPYENMILTAYKAARLLH
jgi:hypothetical protein